MGRNVAATRPRAGFGNEIIFPVAWHVQAGKRELTIEPMTDNQEARIWYILPLLGI